MTRRGREHLPQSIKKRWNKIEIEEEERVGEGGRREDGEMTSGKNNWKAILNHKIFLSSCTFPFN